MESKSFEASYVCRLVNQHLIHNKESMSFRCAQSYTWVSWSSFVLIQVLKAQYHVGALILWLSGNSAVSSTNSQTRRQDLKTISKEK